ncbi:hypothetical protein E6O75_ATG11618 [Venturia nashicola]|uniref:Uncharacterized protein n=1 Tax=Venturia nashicola TaxID=86259 RepID=A0A4Z1NLH8_9PEZI|nr:hypothetical protein E6O75_ATG11618 [Venturia nashicola]
MISSCVCPLLVIEFSDIHSIVHLVYFRSLHFNCSGYGSWLSNQKHNSLPTVLNMAPAFQRAAPDIATYVYWVFDVERFPKPLQATYWPSNGLRHLRAAIAIPPPLHSSSSTPSWAGVPTQSSMAHHDTNTSQPGTTCLAELNKCCKCCMKLTAAPLFRWEDGIAPKPGISAARDEIGL